jgi:hypothetical protein
MHQATLALDTPTAPAADHTGFQLGWDHAHHGLVPPRLEVPANAALHQGWRAGKAVFGHRTLAARRHTRLWLQLRLLAWQQGEAFDELQLTPHHLAQIEATHCPVRRVPLGGAEADAARVVRLNPEAGWTAGNLATLSATAADWLEATPLLQAVRLARQAEATGQAAEGHCAATWWRLAALRAMATPLPFAEAARLPLAALPPNRVRLVNAVQGLQALVTRCFMAPGWAERCRAVAAMLPEHTLRHDFNLFLGALAPRVIEAGSGDSTALRAALENAWLSERVQRRWQHLVLSLGSAATESLLERAAALPLPGVTVLHHPAPPVLRLATRRVSGAAAQPARRGTARPPVAPASHA